MRARPARLSPPTHLSAHFPWLTVCLPESVSTLAPGHKVDEDSQPWPPSCLWFSACGGEGTSILSASELPWFHPSCLNGSQKRRSLGCHSSEPEAPLEPELPVSKNNHKESSFLLPLYPQTGSRVSSAVRSHQTPQSTNSSVACLPKQPVTASRSASR